MPEAYDETAVIAGVLAGRVDDFRMIMENHQDHVRSIVFSKVPHDRLEEVMQDVFVRAFKSLGGYRGDQPLEHWLARIAIRTCCDFWRTEYRNQETPASRLGQADDPEWLERILTETEGSGEISPDQWLELRQMLDLALGQLSPKERMVLVFMHLEDKSVSETAGLMGLSKANVKITAMRSRKKMHKILTELTDR